MSEVTDVEPRGTVVFERKISDGDYGSTLVMVSVQFPVSWDAEHGADKTVTAAKEAFFQAKVVAFEQLGIKAEYDSEAGVLREVVEKTFGAVQNVTSGEANTRPDTNRPAASSAAPASGGPACPDCGSAMYDNRKRNDEREAKGQKRQPDFRCKRYKDEDGGCSGILWKEGK
jgi:hypothetical protein